MQNILKQAQIHSTGLVKPIHGPVRITIRDHPTEQFDPYQDIGVERTIKVTVEVKYTTTNKDLYIQEQRAKKVLNDKIYGDLLNDLTQALMHLRYEPDQTEKILEGIIEELKI